MRTPIPDKGNLVKPKAFKEFDQPLGCEKVFEGFVSQ